MRCQFTFISINFYHLRQDSGSHNARGKKAPKDVNRDRGGERGGKMGKGETLIYVARNRRKLYHDSRQRRQREDRDQRAIWFARALLHVVGGGSARARALSSAMRLIRVRARDARSINVIRRRTKRAIRECA